MFGYRHSNVEWHILIPGLSWPSINTLAERRPWSPLLLDVEFQKLTVMFAWIGFKLTPTCLTDVF